MGLVHSSYFEKVKTIKSLTGDVEKGPYQAQHPMINNLQHIKLNPAVQTTLDSKLLQHSSFPSKPLVTTIKKPPYTFMADPYLKKPQAFVMREDLLCLSLTFKYSRYPFKLG